MSHDCDGVQLTVAMEWNGCAERSAGDSAEQSLLQYTGPVKRAAILAFLTQALRAPPPPPPPPGPTKPTRPSGTPPTGGTAGPADPEFPLPELSAASQRDLLSGRGVALVFLLAPADRRSLSRDFAQLQLRFQRERSVRLMFVDRGSKVRPHTTTSSTTSTGVPCSCPLCCERKDRCVFLFTIACMKRFDTVTASASRS